jgi:superfamily II DNA or RNA helicase
VVRVRSLPDTITNDCGKYFDSTAVVSASRMVCEARVSISYSKSSDEYYIVSGIVRDGRPFQARLSYKRRLEGSEEGPISTRCDCLLWSDHTHCPHSAALYMGFHLHRSVDGKELDSSLFPEREHPTPPVMSLGGMGANVFEYGTIVPSPYKLEGAGPNSTYSSLQYVLYSGKVVNFPIPRPFDGRLIITSRSPLISNDDSDESASVEGVYYPELRFKWQSTSGDLFAEISIFEHIYLFNWKAGEVLSLSPAFKELIRQMRFQEGGLTINDLIDLRAYLGLEDSLGIEIEGRALEDIPVITSTISIEIDPGEKPRQLNFTIHFLGEQGHNAPVPSLISAFSFNGGLLGHFRRKQDAYLFAAAFVESLGDDCDSNSYKKPLLACSRREEWMRIISHAINNEDSIDYDPRSATLSQVSNFSLRQLVKAIYSSFGENFFRYSEYCYKERAMRFTVSSNLLFRGIASFQQQVAPFGITIYYQKKNIAFWHSRISFERRQNYGDWFDLKLNISDYDIEVIKQASTEDGMALTRDGLVLLTPEHRELLKFMRKYVQYERLKGQKHNQLESDEDDGQGFVIPFNRSRIFELFELNKLGVEGAMTDEELQICNTLSSLEEIPHYPMTDYYKETLRDYQKVGYHWLRFLYENRLGACLADDMGLGKTIQTIALLESIMDDLERVLIICPVSIILNWELEFQKFSTIRPHIYHGDGRKIPDDVKVIISSYGMLRKEVEQTWRHIKFDILILDEVQQLKNVRSLGAYAARLIEARFRITLTGTPVENDLAEFYNILDLSMPGIWGDLQFIKTTSTKKNRLLARRVASPFILRRTKSQVLTELPPKEQNDVYLTLTDGEMEYYRNNMLKVKARISVATSRYKYGEILKGLLELRQSCLWQQGEVVDGTTKGGVAPSIISTKINFLLEQLDQIQNEGHQTIIFSQFTTYLDIIQNAIRERHWTLSRIDGSQSIKRRQREVDVFQDGKSSIFLISLKAGGVGLNLTAASYVFIMDPWWNPAVESQAIDRAHRIGQKNKLTVYRPIIKGSVEEKVLKLQEGKRELFYDLLPEDDDRLFTGKLSMNDFELLFD